MDKKLTSAEKTEFIEKLNQQLAISSMQEMLSTMTEKCFNKCVFKPGSQLDSSETKCIGYCVERYMEGRNLVTHGLVRAIQNQRQSGALE